MVRIKALFVLLGVTALSAYTIGRYSISAHNPPGAAVTHTHPVAVKVSGAPKARKPRTPNDR